MPRPLLKLALLLAPLLAATALRAAPAPDAEITKVLNLMQQDKAAEALKRVEALLVLYEDDARLAQLRDRLASTTKAPDPGAASAAGQASPWAALSVLDRVSATAVEAAAREAEKLPAGAERKGKFGEMLERTTALTAKYPDHARLWLFHGVAALERDDFAAGYAAGEKLLALNPEPDAPTLQVLAGLERKGWLGEKGSERKAREELAIAKGKEHWAHEGRDREIADLGLKLIAIAPGTFHMGSASGGGGGEQPVTTVTLTRGYWLGNTEVTQAQWQAVMGNNPSQFQGADRPVENVSWDDAMSFCRRLTERERAAGRLPDGYAYTLPTEAQWEYACRAGTTGDYAGPLDEMGWYRSNSDGGTQPVAKKRANAWSLYDMHGNVWEWCLDWFGAYLGATVTDPRGPASGASRVPRGGSYVDSADFCRSANRFFSTPDFRNNDLGFRLALSRED